MWEGIASCISVTAASEAWELSALPADRFSSHLFALQGPSWVAEKSPAIQMTLKVAILHSETVEGLRLAHLLARADRQLALFKLEARAKRVCQTRSDSDCSSGRRRGPGPTASPPRANRLRSARPAKQKRHAPTRIRTAPARPASPTSSQIKTPHGQVICVSGMQVRVPTGPRAFRVDRPAVLQWTLIPNRLVD